MKIVFRKMVNKTRFSFYYRFFCHFGWSPEIFRILQFFWQFRSDIFKIL